MKEQANPRSLEIKRYFVKNPGAFFILVFQALILLGAFFLTQESIILANDSAILAYCFLIIGVVLQAIGFIRNKKPDSEFR